MSKIANDDLTQSGTGCFMAVPIRQQWASQGCTVSTDIYVGHQYRLDMYVLPMWCS